MRQKFASRKVLIVLAWMVLLLSGISCTLLADISPIEWFSESNQSESSKFHSVEGVECIPEILDYESAVLIDVIDGDSIRVSIEGVVYEVRYIGIDTPEYNSSERSEAIEATKLNRKLLSDPIIYLFRDQSETDKYDRLLRYVISNNTFVNLEMIKEGLAESKWYHPDVSCQMVFDQVVLD